MSRFRRGRWQRSDSFRFLVGVWRWARKASWRNLPSLRLRDYQPSCRKWLANCGYIWQNYTLRGCQRQPVDCPAAGLRRDWLRNADWLAVVSNFRSGRIPSIREKKLKNAQEHQAESRFTIRSVADEERGSLEFWLRTRLETQHFQPEATQTTSTPSWIRNDCTKKKHNFFNAIAYIDEDLWGFTPFEQHVRSTAMVVRASFKQRLRPVAPGL